MLIKQWESVWRWSGKHGYDDNVALETIMSVGDGNEAKKCTPSQRLALSPGESERPTPNWPTFSCKFHSGAIFSFISRTVMKNYFAKALRLRFCRCATGKQWKFINTLSRVLQRGDDDGVLTSGSVPAPKLNSKSISDFLFFLFRSAFSCVTFSFRQFVVCAFAISCGSSCVLSFRFLFWIKSSAENSLNISCISPTSAWCISEWSRTFACLTVGAWLNCWQLIIKLFGSDDKTIRLNEFCFSRIDFARFN